MYTIRIQNNIINSAKKKEIQGKYHMEQSEST
jgi:hypothetical protein